MTYAKIVTDSISDAGQRLTTFEVEFHRFVLAEFNTHRVFSRNSASSRAIPVHKQMSKIEENLAIPVKWPAEKSGMQGGEELPEENIIEAQKIWEGASLNAIAYAEDLVDLNIHKSLVNRLLEPFMWHTVIVTATEWKNFFKQRVSPLAQPEIAAAATLMKKAYEASEPIVLKEGEYHLPYIREEDEEDLASQEGVPVLENLIKISVARCARVSYLTHDGKRSLDKDLELYDRLVSADPMHASPLEHVATPDPENILVTKFGEGLTQQQIVTPRYGNFLGWRQHRLDVELERNIYSYE